MEEWSVSQSTEIEVDFPVYELWLQGKRTKEILESYFSPQARQSVSDEVIHSHIRDQSSLYLFLKSFLEHPWNLVILRHQLNPLTINRLISIYYSFNQSFARELLNHRISSKLRKDVDEIASKLKIPIVPCLRYFDNFRNVLSKFEDCDNTNIVDYIRTTFSMNEDMAKNYAAIVFLQYFKLDINKRRLQFLTFADLCSLSIALMRNWTSLTACDLSEYLDRDFFTRLIELKSVDSEKLAVITDFVSADIQSEIGSSVDSKESVRSVIKELLYAAAHLRDIKEILHNLSKISEAAFSLSLKAFSSIFAILSRLDWTTQFTHLSPKDSLKLSAKDWDRFLNCSRICCEIIHKSAHLDRA